MCMATHSPLVLSSWQLWLTTEEVRSDLIFFTKGKPYEAVH